MKTKTIKLSDIVIDAGTQQREKINDEIVSEYSEAMKCGAQFPAVTVFYNSIGYYLADGFHRYFACKSAGINELIADVHEGTKRDAILFSAGVNGAHGIRLTNADKRKSVFILLNDDEWSQWSNRDIAKHCKVGHSFVDKLRKEMNAEVPTVGKKTPITAPVLEVENEETEEFDQKEHEFQEESREELYGGFNPEAEIESLQKEVSKLNSIIESDDKLAAAMAEINRLNSLIEVIESQKRVFQSSENAAKKAATMWKNKYEKLEKKMKASGLVEF